MKVLAACFVVTVAILCVLAHVVIAARRVEVTVRPTVAFAPSDMRIQVRLQPDTEDRWIDVTADNGGDFYRRSAWTIEPDRTLYVVNWQKLPAGEYEIRVMVGHGDTVRVSERAVATLKGIEP